MRASKRKDEVPVYLKVSLSTGEAGAVAGVGLNTIYRAINSGELVARKLGARTLILRSDLEAWLQKLPKAVAKSTQ
jgi:excisionase family DNA binding protein